MVLTQCMIITVSTNQIKSEPGGGGGRRKSV